MKVTTTITIEGSMKMFIIPNTPVQANKDSSYQPWKTGEENPRQSKIDAFNHLARLNGKLAWDPSDPLVEVWFHNEETKNLVDHGMDIEINGVHYDLRLKTGSYLPSKYLKGLRDGESIQIQIPCTLINRSQQDQSMDAIWNATLTADQRNSRYCGFGTFDRCLRCCLSATTRIYGGLKEHNFEPYHK